MDTAYAPELSSEADRTSQLLASITQSLLELFDTDRTFFISNESMRVLISGLSQRLDDAVQAGKEDVLFTQWNNNMPQTKRNLLNIASEYPLLLDDGRRMPVMNEDKSSQLLGLCPDAPEY